MPTIRLERNGLNLRAAPGYRPRFVPTDQVRQGDEWFTATGIPLRLEGCDFRGGQAHVLFLGGNGPWEIVNCRFQSRHGGVAIDHRGPGKLRVADCSVVNGPIVLASRDGVMDAELSNNLMRLDSFNCALGLNPEGEGAIHLRLQRNTFLAPRGLFWVGGPSPGRKKAVIEATENVFWTFGHFATVFKPVPLARVKDVLSWKGRDNLYVGPARDGSFLDCGYGSGKEELLRNGLVGWKELWGTDAAGVREAPEVFFRWSEIYRSSPDAAAAALRRETERARKMARLGQLGPDWNVVGPGDAYVRALAAAGHAVSHEGLRREPDEGGPFAVVHGGRADRGHASVALAVEAGADGDAIEILADGPFDSVQFSVPPDSPKTLTVRALPGYRPVLRGQINLHKGTVLAFEGIHFQDAGAARRWRCLPSRRKTCLPRQLLDGRAIKRDGNLRGVPKRPGDRGPLARGHQLPLVSDHRTAHSNRGALPGWRRVERFRGELHRRHSQRTHRHPQLGDRQLEPCRGRQGRAWRIVGSLRRLGREVRESCFSHRRIGLARGLPFSARHAVRGCRAGRAALSPAGGSQGQAGGLGRREKCLLHRR